MNGDEKKLNLRMEPALYDRVKQQARRRRQSLNAFILSALEEAIGWSPAASEDEPPIPTLTLMGQVAAGVQIDATQEREVRVPGDYDPETHFVLEVCGESMEPRVHDGSLIVVRRLPYGTKPKKGDIVVYADDGGASLKQFGYCKANDPEKSDAMGNDPVLRSINPDFPNVEPCDFGQIQGVFVEALQK